jgi:formate C-acetyltransferase
MTTRVRERFAQAKRRRGWFWLRRTWWGESLRETEGRPPAIRLALAFENLLRHIPVAIQPGELIVGLHPASEAPASPPPWVSLMPSQEPLRLPEERAALQAGVFSSGHKTGHLTPNFRRLLGSGLDGVLRQAEAPRPEATEPQQTERQAMAIALRAASRFVERYAELAGELAVREPDPARRAELATVLQVCRHVAQAPARGLHEALQLVWFAYLLECMEEGESTAAFALGRFDQYLWPYWQADRQAGLSRVAAAELVACFWVKLNEFSGLQVLNLTLGGTTRDGHDAVNELSHVCLELMDEFRSAVPSLSVRWHPGIDRAFLRRATRLATAGFGQPAFYGDAAAIRSMTAAGVAPGDAVEVVPGGCVELGVEGCCHPWVGNFFSLPKCLELALHDGIEPRTRERLGPATGAPAALETFEKLCAAYQRQVEHFLGLMARSDNTTDTLAGQYSPFPFLSALVDDCLERGLDITQGGARYNFTEVQGIGLAHVVDSLLNLRRLVYDTRELALADLLARVDADFAGDAGLRRRLQSLRPAYGDGAAETQELVRRVAHGFFAAVERSGNPRGGPHRAGLLVWTLYHDWADCVGPLPDGRRRGEALVSSIGPRGEVAVESPTSIIRDVTAFDHWRCTGALTLNLRFSREAVANTSGLEALESLLGVYFGKGGLQVQLNVVDSTLLRQAQADPAAHVDLVVRVSGFAARFVTLSPRIQDEIIARAELATGVWLR